MTIASERKSRPRTAGFFFLFVLLLSAPVLAAAQEAARIDVFGGYAFRRIDSPTFGFADYSYLHGWNASATGNLTLKWGVVLDLGGQYGSQMKVYNFMFGPQYTWRREKSRFFVHGLIGKGQNRVDLASQGRSSVESVGRAFAGGGGFEWDWSKRITIRVVQADYINTNNFSSTQHDVRVSTGLVFHFGHIGHHPKL